MRLALAGEQLGHGAAEQRRRFHRADPGRIERAKLVGCGALAAGNDRAGVAHALARGCRYACDIGHDRLADILADVLGRSFFVAAADLAHHDDAFGLRVALEQLETIDEIHAAHRIAADADTGALPEAGV